MRTSTGKRKLRTEDKLDIEEGTEEGETSQLRKSVAKQDQIKFKKLEMPMFNGDYPDGWFYRAEHYFQLHLLKEQEKLKIAIVSLEGKGLSWFRWAENRQKFKSWRVLGILENVLTKGSSASAGNSRRISGLLSNLGGLHF